MRLFFAALFLLVFPATSALAQDDAMEVQRCIWRCLANANGADDPAYQQCIDERCNGEPAANTRKKTKKKSTKSQTAQSARSAGTGWQQAGRAKHQVSLALRSSDGKFDLGLSCLRTSGGTLYHHLVLDGPAEWPASDPGISIDVSIDGTKYVMELDGAHEGIVLSDSLVDNTVALSEGFVTALQSGAFILVTLQQSATLPGVAAFDASGSAPIFQEYRSLCAAIAA